ncbi:MAG TPA: tRNA uridine-5-carboxymethylaminomethyl(34) synthesis GTPase MnmE [Rickettsiales bacterium]|nr:tRNA uridine-5-carboxymethylaminomethyl(34) synthesis GTPase MnmE [Rickettsiales bacterium]
MDTIFAPITLKGNCSVYVIRISGSEVLNCLANLGVKKTLKHREATLCVLKDKNNNTIDEALVVYFNSPNSFTGENICEISLHCSNYIISKVSQILLSTQNVRIAERGEFSKRAFLNGKIDLMQAESILDLIKSETELQHKLAINQLQGKNSNFYNTLREKIVSVLSILEAFIDFPEENIPQDLESEIEVKIQNIRTEIKNNLNDNRIGEKIKDGFHIAIIGEPNSGKSTLLNFLSQRDIAIVSNIAGTTRDVIEVDIDINGIPVILYDTAGIRETTDIIESEGVKRALKKAENADLKILVIGADNTNINKQILNLIDENTIILINKIDLNCTNKFKADKGIVLEISLKDNLNLDKFLNTLIDKLETIVSPNINTTITNERYRQELIEANKYLDLFTFKNPIEINAENIRLAANHIGKITGKIDSEEILDNIFSKFCIGK